MATVTFECVARHQVAELVHHLHRHRRADRHAGRRARRLHAEDQVVRRADVMVNEFELPRPGRRRSRSACSRLPTLSIDRSLNVAMPPDAARVSVPLSVPPPGLAPMATVTFEAVGRHQVAEPVQHLHRHRRADATPAAVVVGCTPKARWSAVAAP